MSESGQEIERLVEGLYPSLLQARGQVLQHAEAVVIQYRSEAGRIQKRVSHIGHTAETFLNQLHRNLASLKRVLDDRSRLMRLSVCSGLMEILAHWSNADRPRGAKEEIVFGELRGDNRGDNSERGGDVLRWVFQEPNARLARRALAQLRRVQDSLIGVSGADVDVRDKSGHHETALMPGSRISYEPGSSQEKDSHSEDKTTKGSGSRRRIPRIEDPVFEQALRLIERLYDTVVARAQIFDDLISGYLSLNWDEREERKTWALGNRLSDLLESSEELRRLNIKLLEDLRARISAMVLEVLLTVTERDSEHRRDRASLSKLHDHYHRLTRKAVRTDRPEELRRLAAECQGYFERVDILRQRLNELARDTMRDGVLSQLVYFGTQVELKQGTRWMGFSKLSFGQRCSIVLALVLARVEAQIVLIDQPEDHLDAASVNEILVPTIRRLASDRQFIIVTHNANLALDLPVEQLVIVESVGDNGRIGFRGSPKDPGASRRIFRVLV